MRRLTGLLASLLLVHLTLVGADLACAKHGVHEAHGAQSDTPLHGDHHAPPQPDAPGGGDMTCQVPTLPACCQALASCGVLIADERSVPSVDLSYLVGGVRSGAEGTPTSWTLEPDPPPPKA